MCIRDSSFEIKVVVNGLDLVLRLADNLQRIHQTRESNDGGAVLIVVEDRDVALGLKLLFNFEAARSRDVLEVDAAAAAGNHVNGVYDLVDILGLDADRERIDVTERLEQLSLIHI